MSRRKNQERKSQKSTLMKNSESHEKKEGEKDTVKGKRKATIEDLSLERQLDLKMAGAKNKKNTRNKNKNNHNLTFLKPLKFFLLSLPLTSS